MLFHDSKSLLQEYVQKIGNTLTYREISETGPDHNKTYEVEVVITGADGEEKTYEKGVGNTKKGAEQIAAHKTLLTLGVY